MPVRDPSYKLEPAGQRGDLVMSESQKPGRSRVASIGLRAGAGLLLSLGFAAARAADLSVPMTTLEPPPLVIEGPTFSFIAYFWAPSISGRTSTLPPLPATDIDESFTDVIKDFDGGIMGSAELRYGRWGLLTDLMWSQVSPGGTLPGGATVGLRSRSLTVQGDLLYRIYQDETVLLDIGPGLRFWNLDNKLDISGGILPGTIKISEGESWFDPVIAGRAKIRVTGPWSFSVLGDIGGFDVGSKLTYQVVGLVNYELNQNWEFHAGYRILSVDYDRGGFLYDVRQYGPMLGATYRF